MECYQETIMSRALKCRIGNLRLAVAVFQFVESDHPTNVLILANRVISQAKTAKTTSIDSVQVLGLISVTDRGLTHFIS